MSSSPEIQDDEELFEDALEDTVPSDKLTVKKSKSKVGRKLSKLLKDKSPKNGNGNGESDESGMSLSENLEEAHLAVEMFLNNNFEEARNIVQPLADKSIYHALGYSVFMYLKAVMTFESKHIEEASIVLSDACDTINTFRRKTGIVERILSSGSSSNGGSPYDAWTETEVHAELCYAEVLLLKAVLTLCEDETLVSFVKAGLKVRTCYQSFRECWTILNQRNWDDASNKEDFESGVRMGVGTFNLMISMLPARVMRLLEFIGFGGNRGEQDSGIIEIRQVYESKKGLRQFLSSIVLLGYHLMLSFFIGNVSDCDFDLCKQILDEKLERHPNGAFFLFFKGRLHFVQGEMAEAMQWYKASCDSQDEWPQFHHICYWELVWTCQYSRDWKQALFYSDKLFQESRWSKCFYAYQKAAMMCMLQEELTPEQRQEQIELMKSLPGWKQRIAGKSLPMEKFAVRKAERFLAQGNRLMLPSLELIYVWNGFRTLGKSWGLIEPVYVIIENAIKETNRTKDSNDYYSEDLCLLMLLRGMCLKHMNSPLQAEECFMEVMSYTGKLKADTYLVPYATFEYALLLKDQGQLMTSMATLERAKNDFKDYSLQSRLHFRIHAAQNDIKAREKSAKKAGSTSGLEVDNVLPLSPPSSASSNGTSFHLPKTEEEAIKILQGQ